MTASSYEEMRKYLPLALPNVRSGLPSEAKEIKDNLSKALKEFNKSEAYRQRVKNYAKQVSIKQAYNM